HARLGKMQGMALSPDGKHLAIVSHGEPLQIFPIDTLDLVQALPYDFSPPVPFRLSPDGTLLIHMPEKFNRTAVVRELLGGHERPRIPVQLARMIGARLSPDNRLLACVAQDETVTIHDLGTGQVRLLPGPARPADPAKAPPHFHANSLAFSPDGQQ